MQPPCRIGALDKADRDWHNAFWLVTRFPALPAQQEDGLLVGSIFGGSAWNILTPLAPVLTDVRESENIFAWHRTFLDRRTRFLHRAAHHRIPTTATRSTSRSRSFARHSMQTGPRFSSCSDFQAPGRVASKSHCGGALTLRGCRFPPSRLGQNRLPAGALFRQETSLNT